MSEAVKAIEGQESRGGPPAGLSRAGARLSRLVGDLNPVLGREVLSIMRLRSVKLALVVLPLVLTGLLLFVAEYDRQVGSASAERGNLILMVAVTAALYMASLIGSVLGAQAISGERQSGTLDLLLATGMTPWQIVAGKTAASWMVLALLIFICVPPMGICFVVGGVSPVQLGVAVASVLVLALVPVTIGVSLGAAIRSPRLAVGASVLVVAVAVPWVVSMLWMAVLVAMGAHESQLGWFFRFPEMVSDPWRGLVGGLVLPAYLIAIPCWLMLAVAVHALSSAATDRAKPLRSWMKVAGPAGALVVGAVAWVTAIDVEGSLLLLGCLGVVLGVGVLALAAHPAPRRRTETARWRLPESGPVGGGLFSLVVAGASLLLAAAVLAPSSSFYEIPAVGILLSFLVCIAGGGVLFASLLKPRNARIALFGLGAFVLRAPLIASVLFELLFGWRAGSHDPVIGLSPLGAYFDLTATASRGTSTGEPGVTIVLWTIMGVAFGVLGAVRLKERERKKARG